MPCLRTESADFSSARLLPPFGVLSRYYCENWNDSDFLPDQGERLPALLIELKWNKCDDAAIGQIKEKYYPAVLEHYNGSMILIGINYDEKT